MKRSDQPFLVGRKTSKGTTVVVLGPQHGPGRRPEPRPRIRGPWTLRAVVTPLGHK